MEKIIEGIIRNAKKDKDILAVAQFGSSLKTQNYRDIDICLFLKEKLTNPQMTKKRLDFIAINPDKLDVQIFQQLPMYIRMRILKEAKILFCKNQKLLYEIAYQTIKDFNSYEKLYEMYLNKVENG